MKEISRQDFVNAFVQAGTTENAERLCERLDIILTQLKADIDQGRGSPKQAANCLRGALLRLEQAYGNDEVGQRVQELVTLTIAITGI